MGDHRGGVLIYKCRSCGDYDEPLRVPDVQMAIVGINTWGTTARLWPHSGIVGRLTGIHHCNDRAIGVTDLVGGRTEE